MCGKGLYNRIRLVLDLKQYYYLAGEYMYCSLCGGTYIAWDQRMLDQLSDGQRSKFPAVLTRKYACDRSVVSLLRARTLGNSSTALANNVHELHTNEWLLRHTAYLSDCKRHKKGLQSFHLPIPQYEEAPLPPKFPTPRWFASVLVRDTMERMPELLAAATSIYGTVLKIDSTKKITKKLQGAAANTAAWATNVGNEKGEIVASVLTSSEDLSSLKPLADGLVRRYATAGVEPPVVMYTDRDCCSEQGLSRLKQLFSEWECMKIRLDMWHFMRRIALACTTESHPLYGTFMAGVSNAVFEWDQQDFDKLLEAKRNVLSSSGVINPSDSAVKKSISREEAALHCRRTTRGVDKTVQMLENLFLALTPATDTLGVPLLKDELAEIWEEQRRHIPCLQDPPGVPLYTITGYANKGGVRLPVFRCARGSTSLESFHYHLARFVPGTSASALNFQAFLLDGIDRWNQSRYIASIASSTEPTFRTFNARLQTKVNALSMGVHGHEVVPVHQPLAEYTGESLGVQYLFDQTGMAMTTLPDPNQLDDDIDEGFEDTGVSQETAQFNEEISTFSLSVDEEESDVDEVSVLP